MLLSPPSLPAYGKPAAYVFSVKLADLRRLQLVHYNSKVTAPLGEAVVQQSTAPVDAWLLVTVET